MPFKWNSETIRIPFFRFSRFAPRFGALRLRHLAYRLARCHALRPDDFAAEGQTRAETRIRMRSIDIRIRTRHTAIRVRMAAPAIDHTDCSGAYPVHVGIVGGR